MTTDPSQPASLPTPGADAAALLALVATLPADSPARQEAMEMFSRPGERRVVRDVSPILRAVQNESLDGWEERAVAAWLLGRAPDGQKDVAFHCLARAIRCHIPVAERQMPMSLIVPVIVVIALLVGFVMVDEPLVPPVEIGLNTLAEAAVVLLIEAIGCALIQMEISAEYLYLRNRARHASEEIRTMAAAALGDLRHARALSPLASALHDSSPQVRREAARSLGKLGNPRAAGPLARAALDVDSVAREAATIALLRTLPLLTPDYMGRLGSDTVPALCALLDHPDVALVLSILKALEDVGDSRALRPVQRLAERTFNAELGTMAERLIPILEERWRRENDSMRLLRPACEPGRFHLRPSDAPDDRTLVRPARYTPDSEPQRLLRPRTNP